jgi:gamma-glutamyltranspeptidase/glutathione hydrolase/leukotriene-C4 hydrolase
MGVGILKQGGNAIDASITTALCLGVVSPMSSGIGGGCFIVFHDKVKGSNVFIDSREIAPSAATETMFEQNPLLAQNGGLAVAVLAEVKGLYLAWQQHGSGALAWKDLVLPVATLAQRWSISAQLSANLEEHAREHLLSGNYPELSKLYLRSDGQLKRTGDIVEQPALAKTLQQIADAGPSYIYDTMAKTLAEEIVAAGGVVTEQDIRHYEPIVYPALETQFMGFRYLGAGGSSSGGAIVAGILKFMSSYAEPLVSQGLLYTHRLVEGMKHGFAMRLHLADPEYVNTTEVVRALLSYDFMRDLQLHTMDDTVLPLAAYGGKYNMTYISPPDSGTTHLSVVDKQGNAVALTSTINTYFGSKVVSPSTGILFNNQMDDFSIPGASNYFGLAPSPFNYPAPYKRPLSSMSPSIILEGATGKLRLVGGGSGGPHIITATLQVRCLFSPSPCLLGVG